MRSLERAVNELHAVSGNEIHAPSKETAEFAQATIEEILRHNVQMIQLERRIEEVNSMMSALPLVQIRELANAIQGAAGLSISLPERMRMIESRLDVLAAAQNELGKKIDNSYDSSYEGWWLFLAILSAVMLFIVAVGVMWLIINIRNIQALPPAI